MWSANRSELIIVKGESVFDKGTIKLWPEVKFVCHSSETKKKNMKVRTPAQRHKIGGINEENSPQRALKQK